MINIVVLAKLVPDIRQIPSDAWDIDRGTLRRNKLQLVPNPLDDRALGLGVQLREAWGGRITFISMGPVGAGELCSRALAYGADHALLVSDPACAGSDTLATARVLSAAIYYAVGAKIGDRSSVDQTLVIAGVQSPDGDTAQVPIQVAAFLGLPVVPYVTAARTDSSRLELTAISGRGTTHIAIERANLPLVMTCTDQLAPLPFHISLDAAHRAAGATVRTVTAADLGLAPDEVGLTGSATRVIGISGSSSARRAGTFIRWAHQATAEQEANRVVERIARALSGDELEPEHPRNGPQSKAKQRNTPGHTARAEGTTAKSARGPRGAVWALVTDEVEDLGLISEARRIAEAMGCAAVACAVGLATESGRVARAGATELLIVEVLRGDAGAATRVPGTATADPRTIAMALEEAVLHYSPAVLLILATPDGRVTAPYLAARLGAGLTADCTSFSVADFTMRKEGKRFTYRHHLHQVRPALGGNILATIVSPVNVDRGLPQIATVRPGVFSLSEWPVSKSAGSDLPTHRFVARHRNQLSELQRGDHFEGDRQTDGAVTIASCTVLVSVGGGAGGADGIEEIAEPLATAIRRRFGVETEVSASRAVVDAGLASRDRQVGQTGATVRPDVYIALGISGAIQHRAGMDESGVVIAVNADENAPIRQFSDIFVHGRVEEVVPDIIAALKKERS